MKQLYADPQLDIYRFDDMDVLTTSAVLQPGEGETIVDGDSIL